MERQTGFTLIELLLCLIISVSLFITGLSLTQSWQNNQVEVISHSLQNALQYARNTAFVRGEPLVLTPLPGTTDWSKGMILFADNNKHAYSSGDNILYQWNWGKPNIHLEWKGFLSSASLVFSSHPSQATSSGSFYIYSKGVLKEKITLNRIAHIRLNYKAN